MKRQTNPLLWVMILGLIAGVALCFWLTSDADAQTAIRFEDSIFTDAGQSLYLDGNGYASHADDDALDVGVGDFILSCWINTTTTTNDGVFWRRIISKATAEYDLNLDLGVPNLQLGGSQFIFTGASSIANGSWQNIIIIYDRSGNAELYIGGILIDSVDITSVSGDISGVNNFNIGRRFGTDGYFIGNIAFPRIFYFGYGGLPTGADLTTLINGLYTNPGGTLTSYGLSQYEDAVDTDTHDGAGSVTGLVVGKVYEFTQGTAGHDLNYGGGILTSTGVFTATQTTGTISSGDGSDTVIRTGGRGNWHLNGDYTDETSNSLDLSAGGTGNSWEYSTIEDVRFDGGTGKTRME